MDHRDLNCFVRLINEEAPRSSGLLQEMTFATKDNIGVKGYPIGFGLKVPPRSRVERDAAIVTLLKSRGARLIAATNLDEACLSYFGDNTTLGRVINFNYPECYALGSSSGSASAVAAKLVTFALGSDFGGSIRAPAAACGVYGLKTTPGKLPGEGALLYNPLHDTLGFLTQSAHDLEVILRALDFKSPVTPLRFIIPSINEIPSLDHFTREGFLAFIDRIAKKFKIHTEFPASLFERAQAIRKITAPYQVTTLLTELGVNEEILSVNNRALCALGRDTSPSHYERAREDAKAFATELQKILKEGTILLTPTLPVKPPRVKEPEENVDKVALNYLLTLANIGELPAFSFPIPQVPGLSVQAVAGPENEATLCQLPHLLS